MLPARRAHRLVTACTGSVLLACAVVGCTGGTGSTGGTGATTPGSVSTLDSPGTTTWPGASGPTLGTVSGTTLTGSHLSTASMRGAVVINVWASWCFPCRAELPALAQVARDTAGKGVSFVGIDEQDSTSAATAFAAATHTPYPSLVDADSSLLASLRLVPSDAIPSTLVVRPDGHVAARIIGVVTAGQLRHLLAALETAA